MDMIKVLIGDIFETKFSTIVNTVNCVGVMGKGIAQEFKKRFPGMYKEYVRRCEEKRLKPGVPYYYSDMLGTSIVNFPTKDHWRSPSRLDDIAKGLEIFVQKYKEWGIKSVAFPPLGCGNGGLEWSVVGPLMYRALSEIDIPVEIYAPYGTTKAELTEDFLNKASQNTQLIKGYKQKRLNAPLVALLEIVSELQKQTHANPVGRTIFQKISYIFTEQGVETGFDFKEGSYGPFSNEVKEAISVLANSNLVLEYQLGNMTALRIGPEFESVREKFADQIRPLEKKINKTVDLFSRIKSTAQAEEVTTVLFVAKKLKKNRKDLSVTERDVFDYILDWKKSWQTEEKKLSMASTIRNLEILGWLKLQYSETLPSEDIYEEIC